MIVIQVDNVVLPLEMVIVVRVVVDTLIKRVMKNATIGMSDTDDRVNGNVERERRKMSTVKIIIIEKMRIVIETSSAGKKESILMRMCEKKGIDGRKRQITKGK
jgi:hypothetical protein